MELLEFSPSDDEDMPIMERQKQKKEKEEQLKLEKKQKEKRNEKKGAAGSETVKEEIPSKTKEKKEKKKKPTGPLKQLIVYIDAKDREEAEELKQIVEELGGRVLKSFGASVTHLIFSEGKNATLEKANKEKKFPVSSEWLHKCKELNERVEERLYKAVRNEKSQEKEVGKKVKNKEKKEKSNRHKDEEKKVEKDSVDLWSDEEKSLLSTPKKKKEEEEEENVKSDEESPRRESITSELDKTIEVYHSDDDHDDKDIKMPDKVFDCKEKEEKEEEEEEEEEVEKKEKKELEEKEEKNEKEDMKKKKKPHKEGWLSTSKMSKFPDSQSDKEDEEEKGEASKNAPSTKEEAVKQSEGRKKREKEYEFDEEEDDELPKKRVKNGAVEKTKKKEKKEEVPHKPVLKEEKTKTVTKAVQKKSEGGGKKSKRESSSEEEDSLEVGVLFPGSHIAKASTKRPKIERKAKKKTSMQIEDSENTPMITYTGMELNEKSKAKKIFLKLHPLPDTVDEVYEEVSHVILGKDQKRTLTVLLAIALGKRILTYDWALACGKEKKWVQPDQYETTKFPGAKISRQAHESEDFVELFEGKTFFLNDINDPPVKKLETLIKYVGGKITKSFSSCDICLCGSRASTPRGYEKEANYKAIVELKYLFDSISEYKVLDEGNYLVSLET